MNTANMTFLLFATFSSLRIFSYLPQIRRVALDNNGASAISYATWGLWTGANVATALYAAINLQDLYLSVVSAIYAICCIVVILLTARKRRPSLPINGEDRQGVRSRAKIAIGQRPAREEMRTIVGLAAAALTDQQRPHYAFERDLKTYARQMVLQDLLAALSRNVSNGSEVRTFKLGHRDGGSNNGELTSSPAMTRTEFDSTRPGR